MAGGGCGAVAGGGFGTVAEEEGLEEEGPVSVATALQSSAHVASHPARNNNPSGAHQQHHYRALESFLPSL